MSDGVQMTLVDVDAELVRAWSDWFEGAEGVRIRHGSVFDLTADAIVSPANSFGFMDGGIDLALSEELGWHVQDRVQQRIQEDFDGELLVGQAFSVPTDDARFPHLICAPTMRVPLLLGSDTIAPYLAMRALLREAVRLFGEEGGHVAVVGLGTGVGAVPPMLAAHQMRRAWDDVVNRLKFPSSWMQVHERHRQLTDVGE